MPEEKTILCLGDSYTIGHSVAAHERFPELTVDLLKNSGLHFSKPELVARNSWTCAELTDAIKKRKLTNTYDAVTLLIGVNDQFRGFDSTSYAADFESLIKKSLQFANQRSAYVFVLSIPDYGVTPFALNARQTPQQIAEDIDIFNAINKRIALQYMVNYIDVTPISRQAANDLTLLATDQLHPSGKMYARWANELNKVMQQVYQ